MYERYVYVQLLTLTNSIRTKKTVVAAVAGGRVGGEAGGNSFKC